MVIFSPTMKLPAAAMVPMLPQTPLVTVTVQVQVALLVAPVAVTPV
jgi:hypothetical protein